MTQRHGVLTEVEGRGVVSPIPPLFRLVQHASPMEGEGGKRTVILAGGPSSAGSRPPRFEGLRSPEIQQAITKIGDEQGIGLIVSADGFNSSNEQLIIDLAARHRVPAIYGIPGGAAGGGLLYYALRRRRIKSRVASRRPSYFLGAIERKRSAFRQSAGVVRTQTSTQ